MFEFSTPQFRADQHRELVMASAKRTESLATYRKELSSYLGSRMSQVAPNLAALIGNVPSDT